MSFIPNSRAPSLEPESISSSSSAMARTDCDATDDGISKLHDACRYNCHLNVEICSGVQAVKYLYKYIYKGHDKIVVRVDDRDNANNGTRKMVDEIKQYQDTRFVAPPEALWRMFEFSLNDIHPAVIKLQLHLPNKQCIIYWDNSDLQKVLTWDHVSKTMLTEFMSMCDRDPKARQYLYHEFPEHYVWNKKDKHWTERKSRTVIGRVNGAHPSEGERYYLRLLLNHVRGPRSFVDLLTVNNELCKTFKHSAQQRGLLESDQSILECFNEAIVYQMPSALRKLFVTILIFCEPTDVRNLWDSYVEPLSEDFRHQQSQMPNLTSDQSAEIQALICIKSLLESNGKEIVEYDLPPIPADLEMSELYCKEIRDEMSHNVIPEDDAKPLKESLNDDQLYAFTTIIKRFNSGKGGVFFVDGPGGTGKTFLYRALLEHVRAQNCITLATATSGVAAHILPGGRTAHSRFRIPLEPHEKSLCNVKVQTGLAKLLKAAKLIIWDEAPMANRLAIEAVDRTLREILKVEKPFGGKIVVFGGDFRQVLPVVPKGSIQQTIGASLVSSDLRYIMEKFTLSKNMRAISDPIFSDFLLRVGNGVERENEEGNIKIPDSMVVGYDCEESAEQSLINVIYPDLEANASSTDYISSRAILAPRNEHVDKLNAKMIKQFPGEEKIYLSHDEAVDDDHNYYADEFLNALTPNGLPSHRLVLKINCPVMLLRNLDPSDGMCNGTRMVCKAFERNLIHCELTDGSHAGKRVFIPRIPLCPKETDGYPFKLKRKQFPIKPCFAMTINKAQGQTIPNVGVYLPQSVFSHGQLYVALSRGTSMSSTKVLIIPDVSNTTKGLSYTKNIVYDTVLQLGRSFNKMSHEERADDE